ncbi:MAG: glycosyltransferase family 61 protein, partial [Pseudomonadota bacterium]
EARYLKLRLPVGLNRYIRKNVKLKYIDNIIKAIFSIIKPFSEFQILKGYDAYRSFNKEVFSDFKKAIRSIIGEEIEEEISKIEAKTNNKKQIKIVIVNRGKPPSFYKTKESEIRATAAERRSIPNMSELVEAVGSIYDNVHTIHLEDKPLSYQFAYFSTADVVIAQHGAALANLIFSRNDQLVIEIVDRRNLLNNAKESLFSELSKTLSLQHRIVVTNHGHEILDQNTMELIMQVIGEKVNSQQKRT